MVGGLGAACRDGARGRADALGRLATVLGEYDEADRYLDIADELNERLEAPFFTALTHLHRAEMQVERDGTDDSESARRNLDDALEVARRHGFAGIERDVASLHERIAAQ